VISIRVLFEKAQIKIKITISHNIYLIKKKNFLTCFCDFKNANFKIILIETVVPNETEIKDT
jgi:hypothetical protein